MFYEVQFTELRLSHLLSTFIQQLFHDSFVVWKLSGKTEELKLYFSTENVETFSYTVFRSSIGRNVIWHGDFNNFLVKFFSKSTAVLCVFSSVFLYWLGYTS